MVSRYPSHKSKGEITSAFHRYAMTVLAVNEEDQLHSCNWELEREGMSYTIETLRHFRECHSGNEYCFIAGSDALKEIHLWKDYDKLLSEHCFIFAQRPGTEVRLEKLELPVFLKRSIQIVGREDRPSIRPGQSYLVSLNTPKVSSTSVRQSIADGQRPSPERISPSVLRYISKHRLYEKKQNRSEESL